MGIGGGIDAGGAKAYPYPAQPTRSVLIACAVAAMGGLIFGYDLGISGIYISLLIFLLLLSPYIFNEIGVIPLLIPHPFSRFRSLAAPFYASVSF
ncbi:sugar carrier protein C-like [Senna tora]|uniref:Sugar carrier protein C-like n=1 Tax=Senna tora TaxID=362788 RepID=A0A834WK35_9FABA|nr:sugar carrier protein C-like [Senna tora]